jgi:type III secretory pathway component EscS
MADFHDVTLCYETNYRFTLKLLIVYDVLVYVLRFDLPEPETCKSGHAGACMADFHAVTLCYETDSRFMLKLLIVYVVLDDVLHSGLLEPETRVGPTRKTRVGSAWLGSYDLPLPPPHIYIT